jgi:para-nitrobenzyl esterase
LEAVVETTAGKIRGADAGDVLAFQGVPFAAPPTGELRFQPPHPHPPWRGVRDAQRTGAAAPQFAMPVFSWINAAARRIDEDCLYLNVSTPAVDGGRRPVLVWIHGGGFLVGSGATPVYDGAGLARRGDVVVVTLNYRLGALGYAHLGLALGEGFERSTNLGVRDQIAALEWVRDNIASFGGDPENVTVFGQSAGGMSVGALLGAPRARKLFHRAICQSGACDHVLEPEVAREVAEDLLGRLGGASPTPASLGRIPLARIMAAQREVMETRADLRTLMAFLPAVDGNLIPEQPLDAVRRGDTAHIPILTGATLEEWKLFRFMDVGMGGFEESDLLSRLENVLPAELDEAPDPSVVARRFRAALGGRSAARSAHEVWLAFQTARVFHQPSIRLAEAQHQGGGAAYSYLVTWRAPALRRTLGACHAIEIPFVFGSAGHPLASPLTGVNGDGRRLSRRMQHSWIRFARSGEPGHSRLPSWPSYRPEHRATMIFGRQCALDDAPLEAERELLSGWSSGPHPASRSLTPRGPLRISSRQPAV